MAWAELHTPMYADMEYLVRIHEPLEELLVVERGLVLCQARVLTHGETLGIELISGAVTWKCSAGDFRRNYDAN